MTVLDASVLIAYLEAEDAHHDRATQLLDELSDDHLHASTLTLAEVYVGAVARNELDHARGILEDLDVEEIPLAADAAVRVATLRAETRLKLPDCCVLLAAEEARARVASFDGRLRRAARSRRIKVAATPRGSR